MNDNVEFGVKKSYRYCRNEDFRKSIDKNYRNISLALTRPYEITDYKILKNVKKIKYWSYVPDIKIFSYASNLELTDCNMDIKINTLENLKILTLDKINKSLNVGI